jgi:hypothetical protein
MRSFLHQSLGELHACLEPVWDVISSGDTYVTGIRREGGGVLSIFVRFEHGNSAASPAVSSTSAEHSLFWALSTSGSLRNICANIPGRLWFTAAEAFQSWVHGVLQGCFFLNDIFFIFVSVRCAYILDTTTGVTRLGLILIVSVSSQQLAGRCHPGL